MTTKAELKMLEKLFAAEIEGAVNGGLGIVQSKSKLLLQMEADGLVRRVKRELKPDRFGPIVVEGWELTLHGNFAYCMTCHDGPHSDADLKQEDAS